MAVLKNTNGNIGGVNPVLFVFKDDILSYNVNPVTMVGVITLKTGKVWNNLYATDETIQLTCKEDPTPAGIKYSYEIKMLIPKDRSDVEIALYAMNNRHLVINLIDKNGVSRYFGTMDIPMKKLGTLTKPANVEGYNGWEVVFTGAFSAPASYKAAGGTGWVPDPTFGD